jgi:hypothetical protein
MALVSVFKITTTVPSAAVYLTVKRCLFVNQGCCKRHSQPNASRAGGAAGVQPELEKCCRHDDLEIVMSAGESIEKGFPHLLCLQNLGRSVCIDDQVGGLEESAAEHAAGQNKTVLYDRGPQKSPRRV